MKKSTKHKLMVFFIIAIFGMSSIAFVFLSITGNVSQPQQETIESPVVEKELSPQLESLYIKNGVTFLRYYYAEKDTIYEYIGRLPDLMTSANGQIQLVVERIESDELKATIESLYGGTEDLETVSEESIFTSLCNHLSSPPPECALKSLDAS